ncbi:MAG: sulfurtransferase TusA [Cellvibrionales bacterium]|nr:MAG: sulfurtransferase TusA [Cellvibrionales bacterium]
MTTSFENEPFDLLVDTSGLVCPEPVMMLHSAVRQLALGQVIKVIATDPSTARDIPKFCGFLGHELIVQEHVQGTDPGQVEDSYLYFIRRG